MELESVKNFKLAFAKHDPETCLAPGLFRSLKKGERKKTKLDVTYSLGEGKGEARFIGFEPLGADDMRLLQGLIALGGPEGLYLTPETKSEQGKQLRLFLDPKFDAATQNALVVKEQIGTLLEEIGLTKGKSNYEDLKASLTRMANVTIIRTNGSHHASFHLLSYTLDEFDGSLLVALNPQITKAIIGNHYTRIEMAENRAIQKASTRLIHQRLCAWINQGESERIELDTLCKYVWPDTNTTPSAMRTRRSTIRREALPELERIGWTIQEYTKGKYEIGRPKPQKEAL